MSATDGRKHVVIVGGGFAGLGCARRLADDDHVRVTLIDRNNYHQFQPLLYQVATSLLSPSDIAHSLREVFSDQDNVDVKLAEISAVDPASRTVTSSDGEQWTGDALVLAAGSQPNFFNTPGAAENSFPLYSLDNATELRSRILGIFEQVDRTPDLVDRGALNFVIVGGGPTGVEVAGALADMVRETLPAEYHGLDSAKARICLLDYGDALLAPFSEKAHKYVAKVLTDRNVELRLGTGVKEVGTGHARLSEGTVIPTRCVIWGGGIMAAPIAANCGLAQGKGGRVDVQPDLTLPGTQGVYVVGDVANIAGPDGNPLPQLGSVALQSGQAAADNILAEFAGKPRSAFAYRDKGIMAMIGRGAAIAEVGKNHHEVHGQMAHIAWLGVHASLMTGTRDKIEAIIDWGWDRFTKTGGPHVLDRGDAAAIDWDDDEVVLADQA
jgi:NADH:ubiquinone reductase (H+-translocating)